MNYAPFIQNSRGHLGRLAFSLPEVMVAMAASTIVLGALLASSSILQRTVKAADTYAQGHASQTRLIDTVSSDLRSAIGLATTNSSGGAATKIRSSASVTINESRFLKLTLPGYYKSQDPGNSGYAQPQSLISTGRNVRYGTASAVSPNVTVSYERAWVASENSVCYIRRQGSDSRIVATGAEDLDLDISADANGRSLRVEVWFVSKFSRQGAQVAASDKIMLRNGRYD